VYLQQRSIANQLSMDLNSKLLQDEDYRAAKAGDTYVEWAKAIDGVKGEYDAIRKQDFDLTLLQNVSSAAIVMLLSLRVVFDVMESHTPCSPRLLIPGQGKWKKAQ